jgi:hypothetical protein
METVSIRHLRGADLRDSARTGKPLAITNHRVLIGIVIPVAAAWVEHLIDYNWSRVRMSIAEGEQAAATDTPLATLDDVIAEADAAVWRSNNALEGLAIPFVTAAAGTVTTDAIERLRAALNLGADRPTVPIVRTIGIGDLSSGVIERAGKASQTLAVTHDQEVVCMVVPVTRGLVEFLIEQNISRVLYNIGLAEKQLNTPDTMTTLDQDSSDEILPRHPEQRLSERRDPDEASG